MIHYYLITKEPGKEPDICPFKPDISTVEKLSERPIFTGKQKHSKLPVFVVKANNRQDALNIYKDFIHISPSRTVILTKTNKNKRGIDLS